MACIDCDKPIDKRAKTGMCRECYLKKINVNGGAICATCGGPTSEPRARTCISCWNSRPKLDLKTIYRKSRLKKRFKLSLEDYENILIAQDYKCAICKAPQADIKKSLSVDHDRTCCPTDYSCGGCVRGLLCDRCNFGIGYFKDDENLLEIAANYVKVNKLKNIKKEVA